MTKSLIDIHCHILPSVDDGADSLKTAILMLKQEMKDGVSDVILTPHFFSYGKNSTHLQERFSELKKAASESVPNIRLHLGQELFYSSALPELLDQKKAYYMGDSNYALIEFAPKTDFASLSRCLIELLQNGVQPILAHAERQKGLSLELVEELVQSGAYIQVNAGSIYGQGGFFTRRYVGKMIQKNLVHFVGSDAHNMGDRAPDMGKAYAYTRQKFGRKTADTIFITNPEQMLQNKYL